MVCMHDAEIAGAARQAAKGPTDQRRDLSKRHAAAIAFGELGILPGCPFGRIALGQVEQPGPGIDRRAGSAEIRGDAGGRLGAISTGQLGIVQFGPGPRRVATKSEQRDPFGDGRPAAGKRKRDIADCCILEEERAQPSLSAGVQASAR
jgi:hypothetical protein